MSLTGGHHFVYDPLRPHIGPTRWFGGHTGGTRGPAALSAACADSIGDLACISLLQLKRGRHCLWAPHSHHPCCSAPSHLLLTLAPLPPFAPAVASFYVKAAWSPDGSHIISGSTDRSVYIWEVGWGLLLWCPFQCSSCFSTTCRMLVWCGHADGLSMAAACMRMFPFPGRALSSCPLPPSPSQVDAPDGASPYVLPGHQGEVTAVAWCPSDFQQVRGWDVHGMCSWRACSAGVGAVHTAG